MVLTLSGASSKVLSSCCDCVVDQRAAVGIGYTAVDLQVEMFTVNVLSSATWHSLSTAEGKEIESMASGIQTGYTASLLSPALVLRWTFSFRIVMLQLAVSMARATHQKHHGLFVWSY